MFYGPQTICPHKFYIKYGRRGNLDGPFAFQWSGQSCKQDTFHQPMIRLQQNVQTSGFFPVIDLGNYFEIASYLRTGALLLLLQNQNQLKTNQSHQMKIKSKSKKNYFIYLKKYGNIDLFFKINTFTKYIYAQFIISN